MNQVRAAVSTASKCTLSRWKSIEIMLAALFLIAPFYYQPNWGGEGLLIPNNVIVWFMGFIIGSYTLYRTSSSGTITLPKYFPYIAAFPVLAVIAGFVTGIDEPIRWFFRLSFIWFGLLFYTALFQYRLKQWQVDRLLFIVVLSAMLQACIGLCQALLPEPKLFFWASSGPPYGVFQQINNQATFQVTAIVISIFLLTRPYINRSSVWRKVIIILFFAISAYIVSFSGSRIGILSALISIPIIVIWRRKYLKRNKKLSIFAVLFFCLGSILGSSGLEAVVNKTVALNSGLSANARLGIYTISLELIEQKTLFGHGLGSFERVFHYEKGKYHEQYPDVQLIDLYVTHPHNEILFWLIEGGVITAFGIVLLLFGIYLSVKSEKYRRLGFVAVLLPIALHTQVELPFYTSAIHWFLALFLLFVVMRANRYTKPMAVTLPMRRLIRLISLVLLIGGSLFFAHTYRSMYEINNIDKSFEVWELSIAEDNPYFLDFVDAMRMKSVIIKSYEDGTIDDLDSTEEWAVTQLKREPSAKMFVLVAMIYQKKEDEKSMCRTINTGLSIYPNNFELKNAVNFCQSDK